MNREPIPNWRYGGHYEWTWWREILYDLDCRWISLRVNESLHGWSAMGSMARHLFWKLRMRWMIWWHAK